MLCLVAIMPVATSASARKPLGEIDFFGYKGLDVGSIRSALPFHEGELFPPAKEKSSDELKRKVSDKIKIVIGHNPTDISFVCCDSKQHWMVYIGLPGESYQALASTPIPAESIKLPKTAIALFQKMENAFFGAVMKGHATEDDSEGYSLTDDAKARRAELAVREYALHNEALVLQVLGSSSDARQRAMAAEILGYGRQSEEQVAALVHASLDGEEGVRNNATRALWVLAGAKPQLAQRISTKPFISLLRSGAWSDHNKASLLLVALTKNRDPKILAQLRVEALDSLLEMARWRSKGHAEAALLLLGRIVGLDDDSTNKLIEAGQADTILNKLNQN